MTNTTIINPFYAARLKRVIPTWLIRQSQRPCSGRIGSSGRYCV